MGTIRADPDRLRQLLENLFKNAIEHGGPAVEVRVEETDDGFAVADDGPGIPAEIRDEVVQRGYTTEASGSGFGLYIVREIADAHGWDLSIPDSAEGGARIEFTGVESA